MPSVIQPVDMEHYPYKKVVEANTLKGVEFIPRKLVDYFLYMNGNASLPDDNSNARCRFLKYLFNDNNNTRPLSSPLPSVEERINAVYNPQAPIKNGNEGDQYHFFPQMYTAQAQLIANTIMRVYMGYIRPIDNMSAACSIVFELMTSVYYDQLEEEGMSRTYAMLQCVMEALNGVNIGGVGTVYFQSSLNTTCEAYPIGDRGTNVGYRLVMCCNYTGEGSENVCPV